MSKSVVFISHEATLTGAPILLLNLIQKLRPLFEQEFIVVLGKDGPLRPKFEQFATVVLYEQKHPSRVRAAILRRIGGISNYYTAHFRQQLREKNIQLVFSNTVVNGRFLEAMRLPIEVPVVTYVHELRLTMEWQQSVYGDVDRLIQRTTYFLAGSNAVRQELIARGASADKVEVVFSSIPFETLVEQLAAIDTTTVRQQLGLAESSQLVVAIGTASWRKGNDWFVEMAARLSKQHPNLRFAWVGVSPGTIEHAQMSYDIRQYGLAERFTLVPVTPAYLDYLTLADVFVLSSREDPFPLVVLEAAAAKKPIVCFAGAGGAPEFVGKEHGIVVPYGDVLALATAVAALLANPTQAQAMGLAAREIVRQEFNVSGAAMQIKKVLDELIEAKT